MKTKNLLMMGLIGPLAFWIATIICSALLEDYNHLTSLVSELGALGTSTQFIFTIGLVISSMLNILFVIGLFKYCKDQNLSMAPIYFIMLYSFLAGPALYPMPLRLHGIVGLPFPFIMLAPIVSLIAWRTKEGLLKIRAIAVISFLIMSLGFLIYFPNILNEYFGLKQRFLYAGWTIWSGYLSFRLMRLNKLSPERKI